MRVFRCDDCGHKMRFFGNSCGKCYLEKRTMQKGSTWVMILLAVVVVVGIAARLQFYPG